MKNKVNIDEFGIFLVWLGIIANVISYFTKSDFLNYLGLGFVIYAIYRSFSSKREQRAAENQAFKDKILYPIKKSFGSAKKRRKDKDHKYVSCPHCGQKLRIPKNKGKVRVKCAKCGAKFDARS